MRVLDQAMSTPWVMLPERIEELLAIAAREHDPRPAALEAYRVSRADNGERLLVRDNVGILSITGPLFKRANLLTNYSGATSYEMVMRDLQAALDNKAIDAILLNVDSPGGEVSGCDELATAIYAARGRKPITAFISGMGCSGAYWIASAADRIIASDAAILGSIGVVLGVTDRSKADERAGLARVEFVSSQSPGKRPDHTTDAGKQRTQKLVDDLGAVFVSAVAKYRGVSEATVISEFGNGGVEIGANAVKRRMADEVGQFEATLRALSARGKSSRGAANRMTATMVPSSSAIVATASTVAVPAAAVEPTNLPSDTASLIEQATQEAVRGVRQRFSAYFALEDRMALPTLHSHLRDDTDVTADEAARILKAAKEGLQALADVITVDPVEAYLRRKIADGALGTEIYSIASDGKIAYRDRTTGEVNTPWSNAVAKANERFDF